MSVLGQKQKSGDMRLQVRYVPNAAIAFDFQERKILECCQ
jgi:hypothetical protein